MTLIQSLNLTVQRITMALAMEEEIGRQIMAGEIVRIGNVIQGNHLQKVVRLDDANKGVFQQLLTSK
jgi:hypothetical protein